MGTPAKAPFSGTTLSPDLKVIIECPILISIIILSQIKLFTMTKVHVITGFCFTLAACATQPRRTGNYVSVIIMDFQCCFSWIFCAVFVCPVTPLTTITRAYLPPGLIMGVPRATIRDHPKCQPVVISHTFYTSNLDICTRAEPPTTDTV